MGLYTDVMVSADVISTEMSCEYKLQVDCAQNENETHRGTDVHHMAQFLTEGENTEKSEAPVSSVSSLESPNGTILK